MFNWLRRQFAYRARARRLAGKLGRVRRRNLALQEALAQTYEELGARVSNFTLLLGAIAAAHAGRFVLDTNFVESVQNSGAKLNITYPEPNKILYELRYETAPPVPGGTP